MGNCLLQGTIPVERLGQSSGFEETKMKLFVFKYKTLAYGNQKVQIAAPGIGSAFIHFQRSFPDVEEFSVTTNKEKVLIG